MLLAPCGDCCTCRVRSCKMKCCGPNKVTNFFHNILHTEQSEFRIAKGIVGAVCGLLLGEDLLYIKQLLHNMVKDDCRLELNANWPFPLTYKSFKT